MSDLRERVKDCGPLHIRPDGTGWYEADRVKAFFDSLEQDRAALVERLTDLAIRRDMAGDHDEATRIYHMLDTGSASALDREAREVISAARAALAARS